MKSFVDLSKLSSPSYTTSIHAVLKDQNITNSLVEIFENKKTMENNTNNNVLREKNVINNEKKLSIMKKRILMNKKISETQKLLIKRKQGGFRTIKRKQPVFYKGGKIKKNIIAKNRGFIKKYNLRRRISRKNKENITPNNNDNENFIKNHNNNNKPWSAKFYETIEKSNISYEKQNKLIEEEIKILMDHIEKTEQINEDLDEEFKLLSIFTREIESRLVNAFSKLSLPSQPFGANIINIHKYMTDLYLLKTLDDINIVSIAKDILKNVDMNVNLGDYM